MNVNKLNTAIIDIGSNTVRLVLYKYDHNEGLHEYGNIKTVARLRTYIQPNGEMSIEGIEKLLHTLKSFKQILDDYEVTDVKAAATAAVRQATNNQEIISLMEKETGIKIDLLSEEEEAYFGYLAVSHSMDIPSAVTIDIGGGSSEITYFRDKNLQKSISFPFGTVSLKEKFVSGDKINEHEKKELRRFIYDQFQQLDWIRDIQLPVIAIGGSGRNIAQVHQHMIKYPISGIHQYEMSKKDLQEMSHYFGKMNFDQLKQLDGLSSERADIIEIALEVFRVLMDIVGAQFFHISKKGIREGLIMNRVLQTDPHAFDKYKVFEGYAKRLCYEYGRTKEEVQTLTKLAEKFYLDCCKLRVFNYNEQHLDLLKKAAKVYSIGEYIELDSSNQHTFYLLANQSIAGVNHLKRVKLALLASYKNREYFNRFSAPFQSWISREELKQLRDFGALLKFIYGLNVSKRNIVKNIEIEKKEEFILLKIFASESAIAEKYQSERQKKHIERLFKETVKIQLITEGWN